MSWMSVYIGGNVVSEGAGGNRGSNPRGDASFKTPAFEDCATGRGATRKASAGIFLRGKPRAAFRDQNAATRRFMSTCSMMRRLMTGILSVSCGCVFTVMLWMREETV